MTETLYPLRASELVYERREFILKALEIEPLKLLDKEMDLLFGQTDKDETRKGGYEGEWFERLEAAEAIEAGIHGLFVDFALTEKGWERLKEVYGSHDPTIRDQQRPDSREEVESLFWSVDKASLTKSQRQTLYQESKAWARERFLMALREAHGQVDLVDDPYRLVRIVDHEALVKKAQSYRDLKKLLMEEEGELAGQDGVLAEAKRVICRLYRRYVNMALARIYKEGVIVAGQTGLPEDEKSKVWAAIRNRKLSATDNTRGQPGKTERIMSQIDRFLAGTGVKIEDGYFQIIPDRLRRSIEERQQEVRAEPSPGYRKYNELRVDTAQMMQLAKLALKMAGCAECQVEASRNRVNFGVYLAKNGRMEMMVPDPSERGLIDALSVIAHETQHAVRLARQRGLRMTLARRRFPGRSEAFSEASSFQAADEVLKKVGMRQPFKGLYFEGLKAKASGGSFKDVFLAMLRANVGEGRFRVFFEVGNGSEVEYQKAGEMAFRQAIRLFGNYPLEDTSGALVETEVLGYHERELLERDLRPLGLKGLFETAGWDVGAYLDLRYLGLIDPQEETERVDVVAECLWPRLREILDEKLPGGTDEPTEKLIAMAVAAVVEKEVEDGSTPSCE